MRRNRLGFTLIEMLVVLAIIALLALIATSATIRVRQHFAKKLKEYKVLQVHLAINTTDGSEMLFIPGGKFGMGEGPEKHTVKVGSFYIGKYEVTNKQYRNFVMARPAWQKANIDPTLHDGNYLSDWSGNAYPSGSSNRPVVYVSWFAAKAYCQWAGGRLATEAEWEYACRAGSTTKYCFGDSDSKLGGYAWFLNNSSGSRRSVGKKKPNAWGIHDMHGNVWEWCSSLMMPYPYRADDGREDLSDTSSPRLLRGGSWDNDLIDCFCRSAYRNPYAPNGCAHGDVGFRMVINADGPTRGELNVLGR